MCVVRQRRHQRHHAGRYSHVSTLACVCGIVLIGGVVRARAVRDYHERTGHKVGFKPAGGIRSAKVATQYVH